MVFAFSTQGATIEVGPQTPRGWEAIEAAQAGDEVLLAPGRYAYRLYLTAEGTPARPVRIRAKDPLDPPVFDLSGAPASTFPGSYSQGDAGRAIIQVVGSHYELEHLVLSNCQQPASQCAGLRVKSGSNITLRDCRIEGTQYGIDGWGEGLVVERTEIVNIEHIGIITLGGTVVVRQSLIRDCGAMAILSGARRLDLEYSWVARAGIHAFQVEQCEALCGGAGTQSVTGSLFLLGNVFLFGAQSNTTKMLTLLGGAASSDSTGHVDRLQAVIAHNTFVGRPQVAQSLFQLVNDQLALDVRFDNNVVADFADLALVTAPTSSNLTFVGAGNWMTDATTVSLADLRDSRFGAAPGFVDGAALDLRPSESSPLRLAAVPGLSPTPTRQCLWGDGGLTCRDRPSARDVGALESTYANSTLRVGCGCAASSADAVILGLVVLALRCLRPRPSSHGHGAAAHCCARARCVS